MKEDIIEVAKRRGFFWQNSQMHGSMAGFYDYAHLGLLLRRKWENRWREFFLGLDDNFYEIQSNCILPEGVFKASGHLANFVDPVARCGKCGYSERADQLLEQELNESFEGKTADEMSGIIKKHNLRCPKCKGAFAEVGVLNMMFPVNIGTGKEAKTGYLSPETAQGAYVNFKLEFEALRRRLPLGLAIVGKAFRNEIAPRNTLIRMREFTQAELQIFFDADKITEHPRFDEVKSCRLRLYPVANRKTGKPEDVTCADAVSKLRLPKFYVYHMAKVQEFYLDVLKLPRERFRFRQLADEEKAFYNMYHWDIELDLPSLGGFKEVAGLHYRTDHDLAGHEKVSGEKQSVNVDGKTFIPHVLEISMGADRNVYALLELAYTEEKVGGEERAVLKFPRVVSPFDAGIFPLNNKDGLPELARDVQKSLKEAGFNTFFDATASIGRRYRRQDEAGTPAGITIDYDSLKAKDCTLRDRDSMKQVRLKIADLPSALKKFLAGEDIARLGKAVKVSAEKED
jgi:glycyl-tRNA synthetase